MGPHRRTVDTLADDDEERLLCDRPFGENELGVSRHVLQDERTILVEEADDALHPVDLAWAIDQKLAQGVGVNLLGENELQIAETLA